MIDQTARASQRPSRWLTAIALSAVAALALVLAACGQQQTLESYFNDNPDEWQEVVDTMEESIDGSGGVLQDGSATVSENNITYKYVYAYEASVFEDVDFDEEMTDELSDTVKDAIADIEDETGISGVTLTFVYESSDGETLYDHTFS